jgi:hypothetical protein
MNMARNKKIIKDLEKEILSTIDAIYDAPESESELIKKVRKLENMKRILIEGARISSLQDALKRSEK